MTGNSKNIKEKFDIDDFLSEIPEQNEIKSKSNISIKNCFNWNLHFF